MWKYGLNRPNVRMEREMTKLDTMIAMLSEEVSFLERCKGDAIYRSAICDDSLRRVLAFLRELKVKESRDVSICLQD